MPIKGMGYGMGQKVPQVGGNIGTKSTPPNKIKQLGGNAPATKGYGKSGTKNVSGVHGNYVPGARIHGK